MVSLGGASSNFSASDLRSSMDGSAGAQDAAAEGGGEALHALCEYISYL